MRQVYTPPVTDPLESWLRRHAVTDPDIPRVAPVHELRERVSLTPLSEGVFSRVYRISGQPWVLKEGRWDPDFRLVGNLKVPLPGQLTEDLWRQFSQTFLPRPEEVLRQFRLYRHFAEVFGLFDPQDPPAPPEGERLFARQRELRTLLPDRIPDLAEDYGLTHAETLRELLADNAVQYHNFLPREYQLIGQPLSNPADERTTSLIVQEYVEGTHLHDTDVRDLAEEHRRQLILLLILILVLHRERKMLPDMRPRYPVLQIYDWLTKTDNVILSGDGLKFVDTRWFWETDQNYVKRGLFIPDRMIGQAKRLLTSLLKEH